MGRHHEALAHLDLLLTKQPNHVEALFFKGDCLNALGQLDEAITAYSQAVALHPPLYQALYNIGDIHRRAGRLETAQHLFQRVLQMAPDCADAACALGDLAFRAAAYDKAQKWFQQALTLAPHFAPAHHNLGLALQKLEERQQGLYHLVQAMELGQKSTPPWQGPTRVRIEVASCCNLRCRHCPTGVSYGKVPRTLMSMELFEVLLGQLTRFEPLQEGVLYLGGEPLLNPNLPRIIRLLRQQTKMERIFFNTNGMLLTEEICQSLAGSGVNFIQVSIDGRSPAENDAIRSGASYGRIAANIHRLRRHA
ncbi:MAG TPA: tetratricopeptide repeat protein, partial [Desulfurivibrionaceae bacterium]|nr:tetratricopeptide repeat protein [Desulfurivibrionaceae bacterium]